MKEIFFRDVQFIKTATMPKEWPDLRLPCGDAIPEVGVVGRSNVGKSSLLNSLFLRKKMVKTSATPGKTQALNFFLVGNQCIFVDFPGYGFAKAPKSTQKNWANNIQAYLEQRESLLQILFLFDCRRIPNDVDKQFLEWIIANGKSVVLVLTKVDKLSKSQLKLALDSIKRVFAMDVPVVCYSTTKNVGRKELIRAIF